MRRTDLQREDGRHKCVVDKVEQAEKEKNDHDAKEAARDQAYEEFKEKYVEHIEGRADNDRNLGEESGEDGPPETGKDGDPKSGSSLKKAGSQMNMS